MDLFERLYLNLYLFSFSDISAAAMFQDVDKLVIGIFLMFMLIQIVVSKFNMVEFRVSKDTIIVEVCC
jgi:hypothetical protein